MFATIVAAARAWRAVFCGLIVAGLLLGAPFTGNPGSQCQAKGKGGGHHGGHKGHKARAKRHGHKRHHARHHLAKRHRHARRRQHHEHHAHVDHRSHHVTSTVITHHHNAWDSYWGHHDYLIPDAADVVEPTVVASTVVARQARRPTIVGLYYYDGWSSKPNHLTPALETEFSDRQPVWGWTDDTLDVMQKQIDFCADHGVAFWSFIWHYPEGKTKPTPLNNALELYLQAPNRQRLQFCLLVANHRPNRIGPADWEACCEKWVGLFRQSTHLRLEGQPLLIFYSPDELQKAFGGVEGVRTAFDSLRAKAAAAGLPGVSIAACTGPGKNLADLAASGYTLLTGYNYRRTGPLGSGSQQFHKLIDYGNENFHEFAEKTPLPYVPVITTGWDCRPLEQGRLPPEKMSVWYPDRTPALVQEYVQRGVRWLDEHPDKTTPQRLLLIYAWNENGEGGYLTPTAKDGTEYLNAVQRAITADR